LLRLVTSGAHLLAWSYHQQAFTAQFSCRMQILSRPYVSAHASLFTLLLKHLHVRKYHQNTPQPSINGIAISPSQASHM